MSQTLVSDSLTGSLGGLVDGLALEDLAWVSDTGLESDVMVLDRLVTRLEAEKLRRLAEVDRRQTYTTRGVLSTVAWLVAACGKGAGEASRQVRVARQLKNMPLAGSMFASGDIGFQKMMILSQASEAYPAGFREDEGMLSDYASSFSVSDLGRVVKYWRNIRDDHAANRESEKQRDRAYLNLSPTIDGMVIVDGLLDPESGEIVMEAVSAATSDADRSVRASETAGDGHRSPGRRRAEGLVDICRRHLDTGNQRIGGERPHINVLIDLETLQGGKGYKAELARTGTITPEAARRIACDAQITRIITAPRSQPLDIGRTQRTVTSAQRRALAIRDGHCRFPGCHRPPAWTDAHHILHWALGGETNLDNLILLCRHHHIACHEGGYTINPDHTFNRPDGTLIDDG